MQIEGSEIKMMYVKNNEYRAGGMTRSQSKPSRI